MINHNALYCAVLVQEAILQVLIFFSLRYGLYPTVLCMSE